MSSSVAALVKGQYESESAEVILKSSTEALLGIDTEAAAVLNDLSIRTVFDLGSSHLFSSAYRLALETEGKASIYDHLGAIPGDIIDSGQLGKSPSEAAYSSIEILREIGPANREAIERAFDVETVRDLGRWPPFHAARQILNQAFSIGPDESPDTQAPEELVPVARRYATESFRFERVFIDQIERDSNMELRELAGSAPLDIRSLRLGDDRFLAPATGALLVFEQSWKPQGLSLGQLLSSVALAPGESTKIAVIDWSRRVATAATENIAERDQIQAELAQTRATSEIQSLTAREMTHGRSKQTTESESFADGYSNGGGLIGLLVPIGSTNSSYGSTSGSTVTVASSSGERDLAAEMVQEIQSNTRQASTAVRSRRASLVTESQTSEREEIRTRILTNYNHSHALTIQYYEVVQIYRTEVRLNRTDRVIFVPIQTIDFRDPSVIAQFKHTLINAVADNSVRNSLASFINDIVLEEANTFRAKGITYQTDGNLFLKSIAIKTSPMIGGEVTIIVEDRAGGKTEVEFTASPGARKLEEPLALSDVVSLKVDYANYRGDLAQHIELFLVIAPRDTMSGSNVVHFKSGLSGSLQPDSTEPSRLQQLIVTARSESMDPNTIDYLQEHALPLSQAIWATLTQQQLATILGSYEFRGDPLLEVVDVDPITFFGNYLVLKYHPSDSAQDEAWNSWRERHLSSDSLAVQEDLVPVPSDGLFAEAVLGRFNASEKIDMTRFWDWQESPIPMQAPDIGPIVAGNHVSGATPTPGQFGPSMVGMQQAQALPTPSGLTAIFSAAQSDLFRDMSGLQETASTLRASIDESSELATTAGKLANEIEAIKQKAVGKLAEIAAQAGMAAAGVPSVGGLPGSVGGIAGTGSGMSFPSQMKSGPAAGMSNTTRGGLLNESLKLDENLLNHPNLNWPFPGEDGSHTDTTMGSMRGFDPDVGAGSPAAPNESPSDSGNRSQSLRIEERRLSMEAPFVLERVDSGRTFAGGVPLFDWVVYDFGIGNADPAYDGNSKGPFAIRDQLKTRMKSLVDQDIWVDLEVYGYSDNSGDDELNSKLRIDRAIAAIDWFVPSIEGRRQDWIDKQSGKMVEFPINITMIRGEPLERFIAENSTPEGRARNRSIRIVEKRIHMVKPPEDYWLTGDEQETKLAEVKAAIDQIRTSDDQFKRYQKIAFDAWQDKFSDMRVLDEQGFSRLQRDNTDPLADIEITGWPIPDDQPDIRFSDYTTDYRHVLNAMLQSHQADSTAVVTKLENLFREMDVVKDQVAGLGKLSARSINHRSWIRQTGFWILSRGKTPNTIYSAYVNEFQEP